MADAGSFTDVERRVLRSASALCDLGLVGVPLEVLRSSHGRAGPAVESDAEPLRRHTVYSQALAALVDPTVELGETIRSHHERIDGKGYPDGLRGDAIPWPARCLAVAADFVGCALPRPAAIERIAASGRAYDPEAVRLLIRALPQAAAPARAAGAPSNLLVYS
jgi:HD-GYP domain-containing protein (c-di-GMP phosphodiesterase class II)